MSVHVTCSTCSQRRRRPSQAHPPRQINLFPSRALLPREGHHSNHESAWRPRCRAARWDHRGQAALPRRCCPCSPVSSGVPRPCPVRHAISARPRCVARGPWHPAHLRDLGALGPPMASRVCHGPSLASGGPVVCIPRPDGPLSWQPRGATLTVPGPAQRAGCSRPSGRPLAGQLLLPCLAWVSFAGVLNAWIWRQNPSNGEGKERGVVGREKKGEGC